MFWLERLIRLVRPMPPTPTPATLSLSLGGTKPRPSTCRGTMVTAAAVVAALVRNERREIGSIGVIRVSRATPPIIARRAVFWKFPGVERGTTQPALTASHASIVG